MNSDEHEMLHRIDERTKRVDNHIRRLEADVEKNREDVDNLQSVAQKNTSDIRIGKAIIGAFGTILTGIAVKITGFFGI